MEGKIVLITGSTSGLGLETARSLYSSGATVILTCRDDVKGRKSVEQLQGTAENEQRIHLLTLNLLCYKSIMSFCTEISDLVDRIDVLICNAGVMGLPFELSADGVESHFATNMFGHFVLVNNLFPLIEKAGGRVVIVSSGLYKGASWIPSVRQLMGETGWDYDSRFAYAFSKLANCLYAVELARRLRLMNSAVTVYAIRPGFVRGTELGRETHWILRMLATPLIWMVAKSPQQGIEPIVNCAVANKDELNSGCFYHDFCEENYNEFVTEGRARQLWDMCIQIESTILKRSNLSQDLIENAKAAQQRIPS